MSWGSPDNGAAPSVALLGGIVAGNGHSTTKPTTEVALAAQAGLHFGGNISLWDMFKGGTVTVTAEDDGYDDETIDGDAISYSVAHSNTGSKFTLRVLNTNNTGFKNMWLLDQLSGDDTITLSSKTKTTVDVDVSVYDGPGDNQYDDWDIRQDTVNGTLLEQFYGNQTVSSGNFQISGGGDQ